MVVWTQKMTLVTLLYIVQLRMFIMNNFDQIIYQILSEISIAIF